MAFNLIDVIQLITNVGRDTPAQLTDCRINELEFDFTRGHDAVEFLSAT